MKVEIQPGTYVVAVSGGVDSMALLDLLRQQPDLKLIVAHYDHGIRHDSHIDREIVQTIAKKHGLPFVYDEGRLGPGTSEDQARKARYDFLHAVRKASGAKAVITAHHHDDMLETAVINLLRGTNRKGLSSLQSSQNVHRPLLHVHKQQLKQYANDQGLIWREDETNADTRYLRNYVRHKIMPNFEPEHKKQLVDIIKNTASVNQALEEQLVHYLHLQPGLERLSRTDFVRLPHIVAREVMAAWLRRHGVRNFDRKTLERLVVQAKTLAPGKTIDVMEGHQILVEKSTLKIVLKTDSGTRKGRPLA